MVVGGVVGRDGFGLRRIGAPGYRAHSSVAMARMFKGIRLGRNVSGFVREFNVQVLGAIDGRRTISPVSQAT